MISFDGLKKGIKIILNNQPYEIIEANFLVKGRGSSILQAKIKNLITGNILNYTFRPSDTFKEAEVVKIEAKFLYSSRNEFFFCEKESPSKRFNLAEEQIGTAAKFLKPNQIVDGMVFGGRIINIALPIKLNLKVIEAPPGVKGSRSQSGTKQVILETGAKINAPLFIKEGDIIEVNTETGEYVRRIE